jgi:2-iminoacetate synthase
MDRFGLDVAAMERQRADAAALGDSPGVLALLERTGDGRSLEATEMAALMLSPRIATDALVGLARAARDRRRIETFSPFYLTNECDAECRMCGMRRTNEELERETADAMTAERQLAILYRRGIRGVALLTGEYRHGPYRRAMIERTASTLRAALGHGFTHVLINIGALEGEEYDVLLADVPRAPDGTIVPQVTMCTFQETYDPRVYARFMGETPENPRSDYGRRLGNFDRARDAGMWVANPGVLLGLNPDLGFELLALVAHVRHLQARGMSVYVSLPRLRKASGTAYAAGVGDDALVRLVAVLALGLDDARVVISTREPPAMQQRLLPMIGVLTPGSPGVAPYTETGARFELEASQFEVLDHRPIEEILGEVLAAGIAVDRYEPAGVA